MQKIIELLLRYKSLLLFLILEILCISLLVSFNPFQRASYLHSTNWLSTGAMTGVSSVTGYLGLREENKQLAEYNAKLLEDLELYKSQGLYYQQLLKNQKVLNPYVVQLDSLGDSLVIKALSMNVEFDSTYSLNANRQYEVFSAKVLKNDYLKTENYLLIDKGTQDGIEENMAILGPNGVIGVVMITSDKFAVASSLLNINQRVAAQLRKNNAQGSVTWKGRDPAFCVLEDIGLHVKINKGDTVVTSGYNSVFPADKMIGIVSSVIKNEHKLFQEVRVKLSTDFSMVRYVSVVRNKDADIVKELMNKTHVE